MTKVQEYLDTTVMKHASDIREAFKLCANMEDVENVIEMIPAVYGSFDAEELGNDGFRVYNYFEDDTNKEDYYFYTNPDEMVTVENNKEE